ncbi:MAG TPA: sialate O-acetylesterase [Roseimicrobium sp.]|nr:sialate O-acetylesterase [Roseimicrobium sp.]
MSSTIFKPIEFPFRMKTGRSGLLQTIRMAAASAVVLGAALVARAEVTMPGVFSDNMVLQQGASVPVWGTAEDGEIVIVNFQGQKVTTKAKDGKWSVKLKPLKSGGPDIMVIDGKNRIQFQNVLVGDVWICSGQSNMEWPLAKSHEVAGDIAKSANNEIRLFTVVKTKSDEPLSSLKQASTGKFAWVVCGPNTTPDFSAVAYYFGRELQKARQTPIGLIHTSWGGSPAEAWMSNAALTANAGYRTDILDKYETDKAKYAENLKKYQDDAAKAKKEGTKMAAQPPRAPWRPSELYNGMIAPLLPYDIKGAIWYQGESNAGRAFQYRSLFGDMIKNWRKDWGQGDFPFLLVQLAAWDKNKKRSLEEIAKEPVDSDWAELREAQTHVAETLPKVGMAVITDVGDKDDIHPTKKEPVGARLALVARSVAYGEKVVSSGPIYKSMKAKGNQVTLTFNSVGGGLEAKGGPLTGFAVCGEDKKFVWATAAIEGDKVVLSATGVDKPVAVRFGWSDYPVVNLFNKEGLPAHPFRTDEFPMITAPKK